MLYRHALFPSLIVSLFMSLIADAPAAGQGSAEARPALQVHPTDDFEVTGAGDNAAWRKAEWTPLNRRQPEGLNYDSRFKVLYSNTGLYFLMEGTDRKLTATMTQDFMDLWHEDVFEVFLWPDQRSPIYLDTRSRR